MEWCTEPERTDNKNQYYSKVLINGTDVSVGDCVALCPDDPSAPLYITKILYMWEDRDGKKKFHGQWYRYASLVDCLIGYSGHVIFCVE